ncbi:hypothetical protein PF008_g11598 [Phytophthora fragariae]|uniref:Uncharacterized protein n=1 Tax=Phytophthora fragariae TaxID=53985 RepID=A0A6G0RRV1_9STRA|nr:hypothetical protein PF008_g11598 [Phytophthora fragariae]
MARRPNVTLAQGPAHSSKTSSLHTSYLCPIAVRNVGSIAPP